MSDTGSTRAARACMAWARPIAAIAGDGRIVRHVLRLERGDLQPLIGQGPAEAGNDERLPDIGAVPAALKRAPWDHHSPSTIWAKEPMTRPLRVPMGGSSRPSLSVAAKSGAPSCSAERRA